MGAPVCAIRKVEGAIRKFGGAILISGAVRGCYPQNCVRAIHYSGVSWTSKSRSSAFRTGSRVASWSNGWPIVIPVGMPKAKLLISKHVPLE